VPTKQWASGWNLKGRQKALHVDVDRNRKKQSWGSWMSWKVDGDDGDGEGEGEGR